VNHNVFRYPPWSEEVPLVLSTGSAVIGTFKFGEPGNSTASYVSSFISNKAQKEVFYHGDPISQVYLPVFRSFQESEKEPVAIISSMFQWASFFENVLPHDAKGIILVLQNPCQGSFSYLVTAGNVEYLGQGDFHDEKFNYLKCESSFSNLTHIDDGSEFGLRFQTDYCPVSIRFYPSQAYLDEVRTTRPITVTCIVSFVFIFMALMFLLYDRLVERRQNLVLNQAVQSSAIVSSLFPQNVADRLMQQSSKFASNNHMSNNKRLKSFLSDSHDGSDDLCDQPIADLFPHTTVLFADIAGFTAWSSTREPSQVFIMLQSVYQAFDVIAHRRKVFKVETIGDSYVAVTGLPDPQEQHALIMARFCIACQQKLIEVTAGLAVQLGPGTSGKWTCPVKSVFEYMKANIFYGDQI
jgi:Adenylate and Guanylate cyclase catalytic domain